VNSLKVRTVADGAGEAGCDLKGVAEACEEISAARTIAAQRVKHSSPLSLRSSRRWRYLPWSERSCWSG
jgi:hypothetical protein